MEAFSYTATVLFVVACILHVAGLILLTKVKPKPDNQRMILMNLAVVEILYAFSLIIYTTQRSTAESWQMTFDFSWISIFAVFQLLMLYIVTDKTATIYLHMRYPVIFTRQKVRVILVLFWIFGASIGMVATLVQIFTSIERTQVIMVWTYSYLAMDILIIFVFVSQFTYFFRKVKYIQRCNNKTLANVVNKPFVRTVPRFMLPGVIVGTYVLFCLTSTILRLLNFDRIATFLECACMISDALTYILFKKHIRKYLRNIIHSS